VQLVDAGALLSPPRAHLI